MIALGIDPGTATCGFGVVALEDGQLRLVDAGVIRTASDETDGARLRQLHAALASLLAEHAPDRVGVERLFFQRNVQTGDDRGPGPRRGSAGRRAGGPAVDEPTPNEVKQAVCGNGAADKEQVAGMVARLLGVSLAGVPDDATDALAVAIGCAYAGHQCATAGGRAVIGTLRGAVTHLGPDFVVVELGGVGYRVVVAPKLLARLRPEREAHSSSITWCAKTSRRCSASLPPRSSPSSSC